MRRDGQCRYPISVNSSVPDARDGPMDPPDSSPAQNCTFTNTKPPILFLGDISVKLATIRRALVS